MKKKIAVFVTAICFSMAVSYMCFCFAYGNETEFYLAKNVELGNE